MFCCFCIFALESFCMWCVEKSKSSIELRARYMNSIHVSCVFCERFPLTIYCEMKHNEKLLATFQYEMETETFLLCWERENLPKNIFLSLILHVYLHIQLKIMLNWTISSVSQHNAAVCINRRKSEGELSWVHGKWLTELS